MPYAELAGQILGAWRVHDRINLQLLQAIPAAGLRAVPYASKGRNVAQMLAHMSDVRLVWLASFAGRKPWAARGFARGATPTKAQLRSALRKSGRAVETLLKQAMAGKARVRSFGGEPVRFMGYLISHESHHRGQIAATLRENGMRLPMPVAIKAMWEPWYSERD